MHAFQWSFLTASQAPSEAPAPTPASASDIRQAFQQVDWPAEVATANQLERCSPTFSIEAPASGALLWISAFGDPDDPSFLCNLSAPMVQKRLFGLWSRETRDEVEASPLRRVDAEQAVVRFLQHDREGLRALLVDMGR